MSLLNAGQRAVIHADIRINPLIIDRATDAFDALVDRGDVEAYTLYMRTAVEQMGYDRPIKPEDRPTAVDKIKTILVRSYADREGITYTQAVARLRKMLSGA